MPVLRTTPSMVWTDTVFGVVRLAAHFEARRWFSGCMRTGLCCLASARWKPGDWPSHPGCLPCTFSSLSFLCSSKYGEVRLHISGGVWSSQFQTCHRLETVFLSAPAEL